MSVTVEQLVEWFPDTTPSDWHKHVNGGGWVQNTAHVADSALVSGDALVSGNARVSGNALVYGNARVSGDALVSGNARVSGDAWEVSPIYFQGHKHSLTLCAHDEIAIGCEVHTLDEWPEIAEEIGQENGYSALDIEIYKMHIAHITKIARLLWPKP